MLGKSPGDSSNKIMEITHFTCTIQYREIVETIWNKYDSS